jgi:alkylated DNA repair protein (DNA oxidative demethylase)
MTRPDRLAQFALFDAVAGAAPENRGKSEVEPGAVVLQAFAIEVAPALLAAIDYVARASPWRHMTTVRGWRMSVAMANCGEAGWLSDSSGYRYDTIDPQTNRHWPALPDAFAELAGRAAHAAGFEQFVPDA